MKLLQAPKLQRGVSKGRQRGQKHNAPKSKAKPQGAFPVINGLVVHLKRARELQPSVELFQDDGNDVGRNKAFFLHEREFEEHVGKLCLRKWDIHVPVLVLQHSRAKAAAKEAAGEARAGREGAAPAPYPADCQRQVAA